MFRAIIIVIVVMFFVGGCAYTPGQLDIGYDSAKAKIGPLSSLKPLRVEVGTFVDKRQVTDKIGDQRNGLDMKSAKVLTTRPVEEIIHEAIVEAFNKNGYTVDSNEKDIVLSGSVETFWLEYQTKFSGVDLVGTMEFMGTIDINMVVQDSHTGHVLLSKRYSGHHNTERRAGWHKTMAEVMNAALENLIDQISGDPKLIEVLRSYSASPATSTIPAQSLTK